MSYPEESNPNGTDFKKRFVFLALGCLLEGIITFCELLIIPTDVKNRLFLGYSLERLVLLVGVLLFIVMFTVLVLVARNDSSNGFITRVSKSRWISVLSLIIFFVVLGLIGFYLGDWARFLRLIPVLVYGGLICFQVILFQLLTFRESVRFGEELINRLDWTKIILGLALLISLPLLFTSAIKQVYPLGFGGLYTLMSEMIARANFHLPYSVPYYGPGGIPFAYPPLGLYLMAIFLRFGVSSWNYLRFAPPLFSWLALVPMYLLARRISRSNLGGMTAAILTAGSFYIYYLQAESGGVVRGLAFGLGLLSLYFFDRFVETFRWRDVILAGVLFGLTVLTHLGYAYYFIFWIGAWVVTHPRRKTWLGGLVLGFVSTGIALPWILTMGERYGFSIFGNALESHNTGKFLSLIQNPGGILYEIRNNLQSVIEQPWLLVLVSAGVILLIIGKKFTLPMLLLFVSTIFFRAGHFVLTVSFIISGYTLTALYRFVASRKFITNQPLEKFISSAVMVGMLIPFYFQSSVQLGHQRPLVNPEMVEMAAYLENQTPPQSSYLDLFTGDTQDQEWIPYLAKREPVLSGWGSEWTGTFDVQNLEEENLRKCIDAQSLTCVDDWLESIGKQPGYIIMSRDLKQLSVSLAQSPNWEKVYSNSRYLIWEHR